MDKRYQVFVSSTYEDLREERQQVMQALLELDCIPAGMELFPASDDDQWTLIKRVIDDCDYYLVISAGRYGSSGPGGIGYTEMEYDYAIEVGKPVIAFLHEDVGKLPMELCEDDPEQRKKLEAFREKAKTKVARFWTSPDDLAGKISRSVAQLKKTHPAEGWVKARFASDPEVALAQKKRIEELEDELRNARTKPPIGTEDLAQGDDGFTIDAVFRVNYTDEWKNHPVETTWDDLFALLGPLMLDEAAEDELERALNSHLNATEFGANRKYGAECNVQPDDFQTIKVQFVALGLIAKSERKRGVNDPNTYWSLTPFGENHLMKLRAIRRAAT